MEPSDDQKLADEWAAALGEDPSAPSIDVDEVLAAPLEELKDTSSPISDDERRKLDTIMDIPVTISMEVGRSQISIRNLLQLNQGSVVELDRLAGESLDVLVNGTLIAHGEVVVVNDKFGIRLTDVISQNLNALKSCANMSSSIKTRLKQITGALGLMLSAPYAFAAAPSNLDLATTLGSLVLVIGVILLLAWMLKRMQVPALGQQKGLRIISQLPVGTKERIAVVQVGEEQFLVGITSQSIQTLAKLETPLKEEELVPVLLLASSAS